MTQVTNAYHQAAPPSQNRSVWLFVLVAIALVGIFFGTRIYVDYKRTIRTAEERLLTQTRVIDENIATNLTVVNLLLNDIVTKLKDTSGGSQLNDYLKQQLVMTAGIRTLIITNFQGRCLYSNRDELLGKDFPKDRDYFKITRDAPDKGMLFLSPPYTTILGKYVINISKPLVGKHNEFSGIVSVTLDPDYFASLLSSTLYTPDNRVSLVHGDGTVFIAVPEAKIPVTGIKVTQSGSAFIRHITGGTPTSVRKAAGKTVGDKRIFAYRTNIPKGVRFDKQIIVAASRNMYEVLAEWRMDAAIETVIFLLFAYLSIVITRVMLQRGIELKRLEESRVHLATIVEFSDDAIFSKDLNGVILSWNAGAERLFGYTPAEAIGQSITMLIPLELQDEENHILQSLKNGELVNHLETVRIAKDGLRINVSVTSSPLKDTTGQVVGASKIIRDITERKLAEQELQAQSEELQAQNEELQMQAEELQAQGEELQNQSQELKELWERSKQSEELLILKNFELRTAKKSAEDKSRWLAAVMDTLPVGIAITDALGGTIKSNGVFEQVWGERRPETQSVEDYAAYKAWWADTDKPVEPEEWASALAVRTGEAVTGQVMKIQRFDDSIAFVINSASPVRDADGIIVGCAVAIQDISELKMAEFALQASEQRMQQALQVSRSFTFDWVPATDQVIRSASCATILKLTGDEAVNDTGKHHFQSIHPDDSVRFVQILRNLTPSSDSYITEYRYMCKDGNEITLEETGRASFDAAGKVLRLVGVSTDITTRKQAETALKKNNSELELRIEKRTSDLAKAVIILEEEIHEHQKAELNLLRLNHLYAVLSETNQTIVKISDRDSLFRDFCRIAVEHGGFVLSWIGLVDGQSGKVNIVASSGATAYLNDIRISKKNEPEGEGPTGIAIREETYYICNDFQNDPCTRPWHDRGKKYGICASASIAIKENDRVIGALTLYADEKDYFDTQQVELLLQMGMDISFALDNLNREKSRKEAEMALFEETTERLQTTEALREKERMLIQQSRQAAMGEMIGNIAHQWRQPLNTLGLYTQRLGIFYGSPNFNKEFLDNSIAKSMEMIRHMSKTIDDFRDYFKPEKEKVDFYVNEAIKSSMSLLEGNFINPKITIDLIEHGKPVINGYQNEFAQVFLNILNNSRDAIIERDINNALVTITICSEDNCAVVTVADNAGGIPDEVINKVFDPYFTTKGPQVGTGIGLFMSKTIIEKNMGGRLSVRNTDTGAEFRIEVEHGTLN